MPIPDYITRYRIGLEALLVGEEVWFSVPDWEGYYEASNFGRIRSLDRTVIEKTGKKRPKVGRILKGAATGDGHLFIQPRAPGKKYQVYIHHFVLETFVGYKPIGMQCRHLNGVPNDNRISNICWGTPSEDRADMIRHGTSPKGERNGAAKLTGNCVRRIRQLYVEGLSQSEIANKYGVCQVVISQIITGKTWKHIN